MAIAVDEYDSSEWAEALRACAESARQMAKVFEEFADAVRALADADSKEDSNG